MPQQTIYIRTADMDKWQALKKKSERISRMLNEEEPAQTTIVAKKFCEHGFIVGKCAKC